MNLKEIVLRFKYLSEYSSKYNNYDDWKFQKGYIYEMSNYFKSRSGLPVNLWLDEDMLYKKGKHGKRLKFQLNTANNIQRENMGVMTISSDPQVIINPKQKNEIGQKEINDIKNWVIKYEKELSDLVDMKIDIITFWEITQQNNENKFNI
jgi:hypothetical protein